MARSDLEAEAFRRAFERAPIGAALTTADGRLLRTYTGRPGQGGLARLAGYLDDYAYFTHGLLCLHDATGERKWLDEARNCIQELQVKRPNTSIAFVRETHLFGEAASFAHYLDGLRTAGLPD